MPHRKFHLSRNRTLIHIGNRRGRGMLAYPLKSSERSPHHCDIGGSGIRKMEPLKLKPLKIKL